MADNGATLLMLKGHDGEFEIFEDDVWREIDGQPLYEDEIAAPGEFLVYRQHVFEDHRDATFEEILHLVHDNGIGIDVDGDASWGRARVSSSDSPRSDQRPRYRGSLGTETSARWRLD